MRKPVVVIVGRPNVGKSTFFNRMLGIREAIVDNVSGVTRDRNYGEVEWNNKQFVLIDTGGYVPDSQDIFDTAIREQVAFGITEADILIFLVDARDGVTATDKEIAGVVRSSGKPVLLVANKVDSENYEAHAAEFYSLGLGEPFTLSSTVGRKTGDFLDILTENFPEQPEGDEDKRLKIAIVGRPNAGKSSLTNALLGYDRVMVTDIPGTTRDSVDSILKYYGEEIVLIDTAGLRKKARVKEDIEFFAGIRTLKAISECDVVIIMLDASVGIEKQDQRIIDEAIVRRRGVIIAINKWDLLEKDSKTAHQIEKSLKTTLGQHDYLPVVFVSALYKQRIFKLIELAKEVESKRKSRISTSELNEKLLPEIESTPPPSTANGKEIKIKYIVHAGEHYPVFIFFANYPKSISENYKRFLENLIRKHFDFTGVPLTLTFKEK